MPSVSGPGPPSQLLWSPGTPILTAPVDVKLRTKAAITICQIQSPRSSTNTQTSAQEEIKISLSAQTTALASNLGHLTTLTNGNQQMQPVVACQNSALPKATLTTRTETARRTLMVFVMVRVIAIADRVGQATTLKNTALPRQCVVAKETRSCLLA